MSILKKNHEPKSNQLSGWLTASQEQLVVIVFYADWAGSAQLLRGYMDRFERENVQVLVDWVNIDHAKSVASQLNVTQIPTILVISDREVVDVMVGLISRSKLESRIKQYVE